MVEWREGRATLWIMIVRDETTLHRSAASGRSTRDDRLTGCVGQELLATRWVPSGPHHSGADGALATDDRAGLGGRSALVEHIAALGGGDLAPVTSALLGTFGVGPCGHPHDDPATVAGTCDPHAPGATAGAVAVPPRPAIGRQERAAAARLRRVLRNGALAAAYQPIVRLVDGALAGVEALARFPGRKAPPPERWFAAAHGLHLGVDLELLAARRALAGLDRLPAGIPLSVNASPLAVELPGFGELLGAYADRVVLELTEHHRVLDYGKLRAVLAPLRAAGLRVAVDDAGAGFASLRHILQVRPDVIKLDRSLIAGIDRDPRRRSLAAALLGFADGLGAVLVAEGIETADERRVVTDLGIAFGQGYAIAVPGAAERVLPRYPNR